MSGILGEDVYNTLKTANPDTVNNLKTAIEDSLNKTFGQLSDSDWYATKGKELGKAVFSEVQTELINILLETVQNSLGGQNLDTSYPSGSAYMVKMDATEGGTVSSAVANNNKDKILFTVKPDAGKVVKSVVVSYTNSKGQPATKPLTKNSKGEYELVLEDTGDAIQDRNVFAQQGSLVSVQVLFDTDKNATGTPSTTPATKQAETYVTGKKQAICVTTTGEGELTRYNQA